MNFNSFFQSTKLLAPSFTSSTLAECGKRFLRGKKYRFTVPPFWRPQQHRVLHPENLTQENQEFLKSHIKEAYVSPIATRPKEVMPRAPNSRRTGIIAKKIGVTCFWTKTGRPLLATVLQVDDNHVISYKPPTFDATQDTIIPRNGMKPLTGKLVVGATSTDPRFFTDEYCKVFLDAGVMPKAILRKFTISPEAALAPGTPLTVHHFRPGNVVDVAGITIDQGFRGSVFRWGFKGLPKTHGTSKSHKSGGAVGTGIARIIAGKKLPGHMGRVPNTRMGLEILRINYEKNILYVIGKSVPGENGSYVTVKDTILYRRSPSVDKLPPFPTRFIDDDEPDYPDNAFVDKIHDFGSPSLVFDEVKIK